MNRDQICRQQVHCLSCPLSVMRTGKPCDKLTESEVKMIIKYPENICTICGAVIPESKQICPMCGTKDEAESFARLIRREIPKPETEFKVNDAAEQAFRQGFNEGMKAACELKQDNERLKRENAFLKGQIEARMRMDDMDGEYE